MMMLRNDAKCCKHRPLHIKFVIVQNSGMENRVEEMVRLRRGGMWGTAALCLVQRSFASLITSRRKPAVTTDTCYDLWRGCFS